VLFTTWFTVRYGKSATKSAPLLEGLLRRKWKTKEMTSFRPQRALKSYLLANETDRTDAGFIGEIDSKKWRYNKTAAFEAFQPQFPFQFWRSGLRKGISPTASG
jgi:hypothetical protein